MGEVDKLGKAAQGRAGRGRARAAGVSARPSRSVAPVPAGRDVRRFLFYRWRLLEVPQRLQVPLSSVWQARYGFLPPFAAGALSGYHFRLDEGRGIMLSRPERLQVSGRLLAQARFVIGAKHGVEMVRLAESDEIPELVGLTGLPGAGDANLVEEWPSAAWADEPVLAEYVDHPGWYLTHLGAPRVASLPATQSLELAESFATVDELEQWLEQQPALAPVVPRYLVAARAEQDQQQAAAGDELG